MNLLELEFIETGIYAAFLNGHYGLRSIYYTDTSSDDAIINAKTLLNNYPAARLLNAIPLVLRALSSIDSDHLGTKNPSELLKYILYRLQCITSDEEESRDAVRKTIRGLHSWYIVHCLICLRSGESVLNPAGLPDMELLYELSNTLLLEDKWHHDVLFEFQTSHGLNFIMLEGPHNFFHGGNYALVLGNFATAYRLLDKALFSRLSRGLGIEVPQTSTSQFEPILIADMYQDRADYYIPDVKFYHKIEYLLCAELLQTITPEKEGRWPVTLKSSGSELNPIDSSKVFNYVIGEVKRRRVDFIYITGIMWLGDIFERGQSVDTRN